MGVRLFGCVFNFDANTLCTITKRHKWISDLFQITIKRKQCVCVCVCVGVLQSLWQCFNGNFIINKFQSQLIIPRPNLHEKVWTCRADWALVLFDSSTCRQTHTHKFKCLISKLDAKKNVMANMHRKTEINVRNIPKYFWDGKNRLEFAQKWQKLPNWQSHFEEHMNADAAE